MDVGACRDDLRALHGVVHIRIGFQMGDQFDVLINGVANAGKTRLFDLAKIACGRRRDDADESEKAAQRKDSVHCRARHPPKARHGPRYDSETILPKETLKLTTSPPDFS